MITGIFVDNGHNKYHHVSDNSYEWYTPIEYVIAVRNVMGNIDLDPASCVLANLTVKADTFYTREQNGLIQPWFGRVFLNPPYNMPLIDRFTTKAINEYRNGNIEQAIILTNNATDTKWFHNLLAICPVCFTLGRVKFTGPDGDAATGARQGQAFFYLGSNSNKFADNFRRFGFVLDNFFHEKVLK